MLLATHFTWFAEPHIPRFLVSYVVGNWVSQWANDLLMWENKILMNKPVLVKGDGPVPKLRRWYSQFYASGEPKVTLTPEDDSNKVGSDVPVLDAVPAMLVKGNKLAIVKPAHDCPSTGATDW
jgi:3-Ketosteroid 9alpha-hydroxylase C-terminal domain